MALETTLEPLFLGTDFSYIHHIKNEAETAAIDITGWSLSFMFKNRLTDADVSALITKTVGTGITISGTYNVDPDVNTQRATVAIADTDTDPLTPKVVFWELKRMDAGSETVLGYGRVELTRGVHRS